jgi:DNA-binding NtrC family response regulator
VAESATIRPLWIVEKETIEQAIEQCDGNIPKAAALLEISASTIYRKRQAWEAAEGD